MDKSRIFITGDLHGSLDIDKLNTKHFPKQKSLTKDDYLIILGDFGLIWDVNESGKNEKHWVDWLNSRTYTTIVVPGNHENYDRMEQLPEVDMFGGKVLKYTDSIFILKRGAVYTIGGKTFFTIGGAFSIDKNIRKSHISWWEQEIPSYQEFNNGITSIEGCNYKVDYVITHTLPNTVLDEYMQYCKDSEVSRVLNQFSSEMTDIIRNRILDRFFDSEYFDAKHDAVTNYLDELFFGDHPLEFTHHFFGHMHNEWESKNGKHVLLYRKIIELDLDNGSYR